MLGKRFDLISLVTMGVVVLFCLPIHELSHAAVAHLFGDDTAKREGRITLNPLSHIDLYGLLCFVVFGIGWAKPVPVNMNRLQPQRVGRLAVSFAGPFSNFLMGFIFLFIYFLIPANTQLGVVLANLASTNVWLALFNLIPVLPLDGGQIVSTLLPPKISQNMRNFFYRYEGVLTVALLVLFYLGMHRGFLNFFMTPIMNLFIKGAAALAGLFSF